MDGSKQVTILGKEGKVEVVSINCATERIKRIRGVEFEWDNNYISDNDLDFTPSEDEKTYGFIAQELECSVPTAVRKAPLEDVLNRNWD